MNRCFSGMFKLFIFWWRYIWLLVFVSKVFRYSNEDYDMTILTDLESRQLTNWTLLFAGKFSIAICLCCASEDQDRTSDRFQAPHSRYDMVDLLLGCSNRDFTSVPVSKGGEGWVILTILRMLAFTCIRQKTNTYPNLADAGPFCIHFLRVLCEELNISSFSEVIQKQNKIIFTSRDLSEERKGRLQ